MDFQHLVKSTLLRQLYFYFIPKRKDVSLKSSEIWDTVFDSYIKLIGLQKEFLHLTKCKVQLKDLMCDRIITGNAFIQNHIVVKEAEINRILDGFKRVSNISNEEGLIVLESNIGRDSGGHNFIDIYSMTVVKYYSLIKYYTAKGKKEVSQMKSAA